MTREQLTNGLRQCLSSNSQFAEYCLPLLHEKLDSDLVSAKIEALRALVINSYYNQITWKLNNNHRSDVRNAVARFFCHPN